MGIGAEYIENMIVSHYIQKDYVRRGIWTMQDGAEILVKDMSDRHIENCINMLKRIPEHELADGWIEKFKDELKER